ncbi:hypothetical protein LCGC14_1709640 [marine sediment metagenome]|uniref:Sulfotransferase domain-containing protein n=1 Tax=marine sediment metagenome TaxID=412755 RepID=A0A0F9HF73_9ZZZZ
MVVSCSIEKYIPEGESLYTGAEIETTLADDAEDVKINALNAELNTLVRPDPNSRILGMRLGLYYHYKAQREKPGFINKWLNKKIGEESLYVTSLSGIAMFLFRLWLRIFPDARILYLIRNGVDVAKSLLIREKEFIDINVRGLHTNSLTHRLWGALHPLQRFPYTSARCVSLEEGFRLWEEYTYESEEFYNGFNGQKMHIRYEDLLNDPYRSITETAAFCGLEPSEKDIREQVSDLRTGRSFAFTNEEDLLDFYGKIKNTDLMKTLKYDEIL